MGFNSGFKGLNYSVAVVRTPKEQRPLRLGEVKAIIWVNPISEGLKFLMSQS